MKVIEFIRKNLKWFIVFICLILVIGILEDVLEDEILKLDIYGYDLVSKFLISDFVTPIAKNITHLGGAIFLITLSLILLLIIKNKKIGILIWLKVEGRCLYYGY